MDLKKAVREKQFVFSSFGVSGREDAVREKIAEHARPRVDEVVADSTGSLTCLKKGRGRAAKRIMISAHMDTIGFVATYIDENGFVRFADVGRQPEAYLLGKRVVFENGVIGVVGTEKAEFLKSPKKERMFIDVGAESRRHAESLVKVGDVCAVHSPVALSGGVLTGGWMDDRIGCFVLLEVIGLVKDNPHDLLFVFTSQEEVGLRGARTAAYRLQPDLGLAVDVTDSADLPEGDITGSSRMGKGAAVKVMDGGVIVQKALVDRLCGLAASGGIPCQKDILRAGSTDAHEVQLSRGGVPAGGVSVPTRYIHSPGEMCALSDVEACIRLVAAFCEDGENPLLA
jgi:endoglucanase